MNKLKAGDMILGGVSNERIWIFLIEEINEWPKCRGKYIYDSNGTATATSHSSELRNEDYDRIFNATRLECIIYGIPYEAVS